MYESGSGNSELDNLKTRIQEQERIIDEYKRALNESNNIKLGENIFLLNKVFLIVKSNYLIFINEKGQVSVS